MDEDKPILVVNLPPVRFLGGPAKKGIPGNMKGAWDPLKMVAVVTTMGVLVK